MLPRSNNGVLSAVDTSALPNATKSLQDALAPLTAQTRESEEFESEQLPFAPTFVAAPPTAQRKVGEQLAEAGTAADNTKTPTAPGEEALTMAMLGWVRRESERSLREDAGQSAQLGVQSAQSADDVAAEATLFSEEAQVAAPPALLAAAAADTTAPVVRITSTAGRVSGTVTLTATATDNVGVTGVQFLVNNTPFRSVDTSAPYTLTVNTTPADNGTYTVAALAGDAAGNIATSAPVTVIVANNVASELPPASSAPLFVGDYSTGDLSQWPVIQNKLVNDPPKYYPGGYPVTIQYDPAGAYVARYELRDGDGDIPAGSGTERTEVSGGGNSSITGGREGEVRYYEFWTKFPSGWTNNGSWGVTNQWHGDGPGSPPVAFGWNTWDGYPTQWALRTGQNATVLWSAPIDTDQWHKVTMEIKWSRTSSGYVKLWYDGVPQTLRGGGLQWNGPTMNSGDTFTYYKEGLYRAGDARATAVIYHAGYRVCSRADCLTST